MQYLIMILVGLLAIGLAVKFWYISVLIVLGVVVLRIIRHFRMKKYFASEQFLAVKNEIEAVISEHNEIAGYISEIQNKGNITIGHSSTGSQAHLATYENTSKFGYKRDKNLADYASRNVHNGSLQVVRNASAEPIKYLIKYFDIDSTEEKLAEVENASETLSRLENAIKNLEDRESSISKTFSPPNFILKHYLKEFRAQVGLSIPKLTIPYPEYVFQYVSAGGNSSQKAVIKLDSPTFDALLETLSEKVKFKKSAAGQRALMTAKLRDFIKQRDKFTCQICDISTKDEEHLLLEIDHIKPVSKGGLTTEGNLQTLCWKCNRTKSNKEA
jgi:HNH endonuclease